MSLIELTNPVGGTVYLETDHIIIIFFSQFLSPPNAHSNVIANGGIHSFYQSPEEVAKRVDPFRKLVQLTLPDTKMPNRAKGPIWFARSAINAVSPNKGHGSFIDMIGQQGHTEVVESEADVMAAIKAIDDAIGVVV